MAKIKTLLIQAADYEDEINEAIGKAKKAAAPAVALIGDDTLSKTLDRSFWRTFTTNENVITLIVGCIQMKLITEDGKLNRLMLHDAVPFISKEYYDLER